MLSFCAMDVQFEMIAFLTSGKQKYGHNICYPMMENLFNIGWLPLQLFFQVNQVLNRDKKSEVQLTPTSCFMPSEIL